MTPAQRLVAQLAQFRIQAEITQEELAELAGYSRERVNSIERLRRNPTLKTFADLAETLGYKLVLVKQAQK